jgi:hypothetical protein
MSNRNECLVPEYDDLNVVVHGEFIRMRALAEGGDFLTGLVPDPGIDHIFGKDIAYEQKLMIVSQSLQCLF